MLTKLLANRYQYGGDALEIPKSESLPHRHYTLLGKKVKLHNFFVECYEKLPQVTNYSVLIGKHFCRYVKILTGK